MCSDLRSRDRGIGGEVDRTERPVDDVTNIEKLPYGIEGHRGGTISGRYRADETRRRDVDYRNRRRVKICDVGVGTAGFNDNPRGRFSDCHTVCHESGRHVDEYDFVRARADDECRHVRTAYVPRTLAALLPSEKPAMKCELVE
jgi:hypothetical protein